MEIAMEKKLSSEIYIFWYWSSKSDFDGDHHKDRRKISAKEFFQLLHEHGFDYWIAGFGIIHFRVVIMTYFYNN